MLSKFNLKSIKNDFRLSCVAILAFVLQLLSFLKFLGQVKLKIFPWLIGLLLLAVILLASFSAPSVLQTDALDRQNKVTFNAPFTLHFSHIMHRRSVEEAFMILPKTEGAFVWKDFWTLEFVPAKPLKIGDEYRIVIKGEARSIWMKQMAYDATLDFLVTGPPFVLFTDPSQEGIMTKDKVITVMFDRPMDWDSISKDDLIRIQPSASGKVDYLGKSAFQFIPKELSPSQSYEVVVPAGLTALDGGKTEEDHAWTIRTPDLKIKKSDPANGTQAVALNQSIRIEFDGPVLLEGIKPGVNSLLYPSNDLDAGETRKMDGFFNTEVTYATSEAGDPLKNILIFTPTFDYQPDEHYRFVLKSDKDLHLEEDFELEFDTLVISERSEETAPPETAESDEIISEVNHQRNEMQFFIRGEHPRLTLAEPLSEPVILSVCQVSSNEFIRQSALRGWDNFQCDNDPVTINPVQKDSAQMIDLSQHFNFDWVTGVYFVSILQGEEKMIYHFMIEDTSMLMKRSDSDLLVWALDPKTGAPLADIDLEILSYDGEELGRGITDENGLFVLRQAFDEGIYVRGKLEKEDVSRFGFISDQWLTGSDSTIPLSRESGLLMTLDQAIYQPGQTIQFQGVWRSQEDHVLAFPSTAQVTVSVEDASQNIISSKRIPMRRNGSFDGFLTIPDSSPAGDYQVTVSDLNHLLLSTPVPIRLRQGNNDLRLEWLEINDDYPAHSTPVLIAKARYPNGFPAPGIEGHYKLFRRPASSIYQAGPIRYYFGLPVSCTQNCEVSSLVTANDFVFDKKGEIKLLLTEGEEAFLKDGYLYDLELSAHLPGKEPVSLVHSFEVHQGAFDLGLGLKHAVVDSSNKMIEASVIAFDYSGAYSEGKKIRLLLIGQQGKGQIFYETTLTSALQATSVSIPVGADMEDGIYLVRAESLDEQHNALRSELPVFISTLPSQPISEDLLLIADQPQYIVGGRVQLLINAPDASEDHPVRALMTYERDGLLGYESLELTMPLTQVFVPVDASMTPGFLAKVSSFDRGVPPTFSSASREIDVERDDSNIFVDLSYEPLYPKPGDDLTLKLTTTDYQNRPLASVLTLNVVDSPVKPEPLQYNRFFSLLPTPLRSALNFGLVYPANALFPLASHSETGNTILNPAQSVYFNPLITTDATGQASVTIRLPADQTALQLLVSATKDAHQFGSGVFSLQMNRLLLIEPILPAFALPGDQMAFGVSVKNISNHIIQSRLELISDALAVKGDKSRHFSLQPGQQTELLFNVVVDSDLSTDDFSVQFVSGQDSVESRVPLRHLKAFKGLPNSGLLGDIWTNRIQLPKEAYSKLGNLVLTMSGSPLGTARLQADTLENDQEVSTYLLAARLLSRLSFLSETLSSDESETLQGMIGSLLKMADANGAYRFWNEASPSPTLTAMVILAYQKASLQGLHVDSLQLNRSVNYLWKSFDPAVLKPEEACLLLWVLGENEQYDTERSLTLFQEREHLELSGQAFLLLNLNQLVEAGQSSMLPMYNTLKAEMADEAIQEENLVYFDGRPKTTAIVLYALSELDSSNPLLEPMANHVVLQNQDLIREFSPETALWTVLALNSYLEHSTSPEANYIVQAKLNGELIMDQSVTSKGLNEVFQTSVPIGGPLLSSEKINDLFVKKNGIGPLYLDAHLMSFLDPSQVMSAEEGMLIVRKLYEVSDDGQKLPALTFRKGSQYLSELTIVVPQNMDAVSVTEEYPAGMQALAVSENDLFPFSLSYTALGQVHYFASSLAAGVYHLETPLQALTAGTFHYLPATIQSMFEPEVLGRSEGGLINVVD